MKSSLTSATATSPSGDTRDQKSLLAATNKYSEAQLDKTFKDHSAPVVRLVVLTDGRLVSVSDDYIIKLWDVATGQCETLIERHSNWIRGLAVLPDGRLVSGSYDKTIKLWDVVTGACLKTLSGHSEGINALVVLPDGRLASGSADKTIKLWDIKTGKCLRTLEGIFSGHSESINALALLPDGCLASGSNDKKIKLWDVKTGKCLKTLSGHGGHIYALAVLPDGRLASGSADKSVKIWDVETEECIKTLSWHSEHISSLTALSDGCLASGSADKTIRLWDVATGKCFKTLGGHTSGINALVVLPDGRLVSGSTDNTIKLWHFDMQKSLQAQANSKSADEKSSNSILNKLLSDSKAQTVATLITEGTEYYSKSQPNEALSRYEAALQIDPNNALGHSNKGHALSFLGRYPEALVSLDTALKIDPNSAYTHNAKGCALTSLGRHAEALVCFDAALKIDPNLAQAKTYRETVMAKLLSAQKAQSAATLITEGNEYYNKDQYIEALSRYETALQIDPNNVAIHGYKGNVLTNLGRATEALVCFDAASKIDPNHVWSHSQKGDTLCQLGRYAEALVCYDAALKIDTNQVRFHSQKGYALRQLGRYAEALVCYEAGLKIDPSYSDAISNKQRDAVLTNLLSDPKGQNTATLMKEGHEYFHKGHYIEALAHFEAASKIEPNNALAHANKGMMAQLVGKYGESLISANTSLKIDPNNVSAHNNKGLALHYLHRNLEALASLDTALKIDPNNATVKENRSTVLTSLVCDQKGQSAATLMHEGMQYLMKGQYIEALSRYENALQIVPDNFVCHANKGFILNNLGRYTEALVFLDTALKLSNPTDNYAVIYRHRGWALQNLGRSAEALACHNLALKTDPTNYYGAPGKQPKEPFAYATSLKCLESLETPATQEQIKNISSSHMANSGNQHLSEIVPSPQPFVPVAAIAKYMNEGNEYFNKGQYNEALYRYEAALQIDPNNAFGYINKRNALRVRGDALSKLGRYTEALAYYNAALKIEPNCAELHNNKGCVLENLGRYQEALICYEAALKIDPNNAAAKKNKEMIFLINEGNEYYNKGQLSEALSRYDAALQIEPNTVCHSNKGNILNRLGRYTEALVSVDAALKIDPNNAFSHSNKGYSLNQLGRYSEALISYDAALKIDPTDKTALQGKQQAQAGLAQSIMTSQKLAPIATQIQPSNISTSHTASFNNQLLSMTMPSPQPVLAEAAATKYMREGHEHYTQRQFVEAIAKYDEALKLYPNYTSAYASKGGALENLGRFQEALNCFEIVLKLEPTNNYASQGKQRIQTRLTQSVTPSPQLISNITASQQYRFVPAAAKEQPTTTTSSLISNFSKLSLSIAIDYKDLALGKELGRGGFGVVYYGTWRFNPVAIKQLLVGNPTADSLEEFKAETEIMANLRSPNIVQFYGACLGNPQYCIVMEYMPKGSLFNLLHSKEVLSWETRYRFITEIACGVAYLHAENILHRDLKSLNVLLDENYRAKLTDFGLSKIKNETRTTSKGNSAVGTLAWMAPELFDPKTKYQKSADIYSLGVTFWEVAARKIPFCTAANPAVVPTWVSQGIREELPKDCPPKLASLIKFCWTGNPDTRPSAARVAEYLRSDEKEFTLSPTSNTSTSTTAAASAPVSPAGYQSNLYSTSPNSATTSYQSNFHSVASPGMKK